MINTQYDLSGLPDPKTDQQFYAGVPFKRFLAWVIDSIIIMLLAAAGVIATLGIGALMFPFMLLCINLCYRIFALSRNSATLGMVLTGIEIRNHRGDKLNLTEAAWHTALYTVVIIFFFGLIITIIMMLTNQRGQGLHDYFLGTTAINRPSKS